MNHQSVYSHLRAVATKDPTIENKIIKTILTSNRPVVNKYAISGFPTCVWFSKI